MQPDMTQLLRLAQSPEGQQLIKLLQKSNPEALRTAAAQASSGSPGQAGKALAPLLQDPEVKRILEALGGML